MYALKLFNTMHERKGGDTSWVGEFLPFLMAGYEIDFISSFTFFLSNMSCKTNGQKSSNSCEDLQK